jgi:hypothetical protein
MYLHALALFASLVIIHAGASSEAVSMEGMYGDTAGIEGNQTEDFLLKQFREQYKAIMMYMDKSQSTARQKQEAHELWVSLQHKLVDKDAELFRLKVKITQSSGAAQEQAIGDLTRLAAERTQILMEYINALELIKSNGSRSKVTVPEVMSSKESNEPETSGDDIEIELKLGDPHMQEME